MMWPDRSTRAWNACNRSLCCVEDCRAAASGGRVVEHQPLGKLSWRIGIGVTFRMRAECVRTEAARTGAHG
jgi:hypothetical protein